MFPWWQLLVIYALATFAVIIAVLTLLSGVSLGFLCESASERQTHGVGTPYHTCAGWTP
jgi:hypothetical protein